MYVDRLLPHDIEAEEAVIGSLIIDGESIHRITSLLKPSDFYRERNRRCYEFCLAISSRSENNVIDQATLGHELARNNYLESVGGYEFLGKVAATVPTSVNIVHYSEIVKRTSVMRQLISAANDIADLGYENASDIDSTLSNAEDALFRIRSGRSSRDFEHLRSVMDRLLERQGSDDEDSRSMDSISSNFTDLDRILGGLQRSDLIILAARPGFGKTALAISVARNAAYFGKLVAVFSLEMSSDQLGLRLVSSESNVDSHRIRLGILTEEEERRIVDVTGVLSELPLYIDDTPSLGVVELRSKARRLHMERNLDLIVVDYLQLIQSGEFRSQNRVQEVSEISRSLKGLARDLNVPIIAVSQLSRAVENRPSHRPMLSDLRESGSIEQDADVVMFIHREDKHISEDDWIKLHPEHPYPLNIAEVIVAKHRHGPTGSFSMRFQERFARFENMSNG
ncbi:MAG: replicative DNA helicase [Chloroflexi bacterium]|nr:replicative DNA helicase [Chloroflexota bacterium]|tara:strand:+ start:2216 stop:3574 length:1359 start_codon:yes stop_codon:yes gene_type:complete